MHGHGELRGRTETAMLPIGILQKVFGPPARWESRSGSHPNPVFEALEEIYRRLNEYAGVNIEFAPEPVGTGPRKHMMCSEPGGIRIEFIWPGHPDE
jgi:hypothetical protein